MDQKPAQTSAKSELARATGDSAKRWTAFTRYAHVGRIQIDNSAA